MSESIGRGGEVGGAWMELLLDTDVEAEAEVSRRSLIFGLFCLIECVCLSEKRSSGFVVLRERSEGKWFGVLNLELGDIL
jgi:hypothetical protein